MKSEKKPKNKYDSIDEYKCIATETLDDACWNHEGTDVPSDHKANEVETIVLMTDSLGDRSTMYKRMLGLIPMKILAGLTDSEYGRFTNELVFGDYLIMRLMKMYDEQKIELQQLQPIIKELRAATEISVENSMEKNKQSHQEFMDEIKKEYTGRLDTQNKTAHAKKPKQSPEEIKYVNEMNRAKTMQDVFSNDKYVGYRGRFIARSYCEGGMSAHNYAGKLSNSISRFFSRIILSHLGMKRKQLLADDKTFDTTDNQKKKSLVIEWSGANDLITVNAVPSIAEAERAVKDRIKNARILLQNGYSKIVLFNLPDLSKTPRYQSEQYTDADRDKIRKVIEHYNHLLDVQVINLQAEFIRANVGTYNVYEKFNELYARPGDYGLDPELQKKSICG